MDVALSASVFRNEGQAWLSGLYEPLTTKE